MVKCHIIYMSVSGIIISLPEVLSRQVNILLKFVMHGQCGARPIVTFPSHKAPLPCDRY